MSDPNSQDGNYQESALTAPADRDPAKTYRLDPNPSITNDETKEAIKDLVKTHFAKNYPVRERAYRDPILPLQVIGLLSFVPAKGARPNENGVYGYAKMRGCFPDTKAAAEQAEYVVQNVDSYHKVFATLVGFPFPLTTSSDYSDETDDVKITEDMEDSISYNVKKMKAKEAKDKKAILDREENLLKQNTPSDEKSEDPELIKDEYITLCVKKAQLSWTYLETEKKLEEMREIIISTRSKIEEMDDEDPTLKEMYLEKYMDARKESNLDVDVHADNFLKFMVEDAELGF